MVILAAEYEKACCPPTQSSARPDIAVSVYAVLAVFDAHPVFITVPNDTLSSVVVGPGTVFFQNAHRVRTFDRNRKLIVKRPNPT